LYARLAQTLAFTRLLVATLVALILSAVALRIALALPDAGWASFAAPVWSEVLAALLSVSFWAQASRLLNVRQGKRLFGLIGTGDVIAAIGAGLLTPVLVGIMGAPNLLLLSALGVVGTLVFGIVLSRSYQAQSSDGPAGAQTLPDAAARP